MMYLQTMPQDPVLEELHEPDGASESHGHLARRAARGAAALGVRQVLTYGTNVLGGVILARLLSPAEFGFFAIVTLFLAFLNIFGGTGLAGNLIRTHDEPTIKAYRTVFTAQQSIVLTVAVSVWFASPGISSLYHLHEHGVWFFRMTAISVVLTSLMVIPQIKMERVLAFDRLALIEVCQAISFNIVAILLAWRHFGILAFALGLLARSAIGAILANLISPWPFGFHWDPLGLKSHILFGVTLQFGQLLAMVKDSITPLFVGLYLGAAQMGYATWAMTFAAYPGVLLMPMQRLYLPFFARLQNDRSALSRFIPHTLWIVNVIAAPLAVFSVALAHPITIILFGAKWLPALPVFYCFALASISTPSSTPLMGLLNALGKPQLTLWIIGLAMVSTWALGVPLMLKFGLFGFGLALIGASLVNLLLYWLAWKETKVSFWRLFWPAWPVSLAIGFLIFCLLGIVPARNVALLLLYAAAAFVTYGAVLFFGFAGRTRAWIRFLRSAV
jgi:O-antigen/teichoic acid export membrane protein